MMKKLFYIGLPLIAGLLLLLSAMSAKAAPVSWDYTTNLLQPLQSGWSALVKASYFNSTSTTAINVFPNASSTNATSSVSHYFPFLASKLLRTDATGKLSETTVGSGLSFDGTTLSATGGGSASSTLLADNNTFSGNNTFSNLITGSISGNAGTVTNGVYTTGAGSVFEVPLTFGDGLTRTANDVDCDTASGSVFGCLSSTDWNTFAGKVSKVGTPVDNQVGVWTGDGTIEGDPNFTWDGGATTLYLGAESTSGFLSGVGATSADTAGGALDILAGNGLGTGEGGGATLKSGIGGATGAGGLLAITAGRGGVTSGAGGDVTITAGNGFAGNSNGGDITLQSGNKAGAGALGDITLSSAGFVYLGNGGNTDTSVALVGTAANASFDTSSLTGNQSFAFPDASGTFCLTSSCAGQSTTLTVAGTANQITSSAGAQDLSANRTWTLSLPSHVIFPGNFIAGNATTTNATTTALDITSHLTFGGVTGTAWSAFCTSITGSATLCDGSDDGGAGVSAYEIATSSTIAVPQLAYFTQTSGRTTLGGVSTTTLSISGPFNTSATPIILGASPVTSTYWGLSTTSQPASSNILTSNGAAGVYGTATSSVTINAPLTTSGTPGALVGGTALTIDIDDIKAADLDLTDITLGDFTNDASFITTAVTAIGPTGQTSDGPTVTFATSSDTNIGLTITGSGDTQTFTSNWIGTLANSRLTNSTVSYGGVTLSLGGTDASPAFNLADATGLPIGTGVSGLGTNVATALGVNVGTAGAFVVNGGALGTPSSGTLTNATGLPIIAGTTGTLTVARGGTGSTTAPASQVLYGGGDGTYHSRATTTVTCAGTVSCTTFDVLGSTPITLTGSGGSGGLSTTSPTANDQVLVYNSAGAGSAYSIATTSLSISGPFAVSNPIGVLKNGAVTYWGLATTSQPASSNLLVSNGAAGVFGVATSSVTINAPLTTSGTPGALIGGSNLTIDIDDIGVADLASADFGSFACNGATCTIDNGAVSNTMLANSSVSYGGVSLSLGDTDATPAFDLTDATSLPIVAGTSGTLSVARGGTGSTTLSGILRGDGTSMVSTLALGAGLTFDGTTLNTVGGAGITAIGPAGQTQSGSTITLASSTSAFNGLTPDLIITGSGDTITFTSSLSGTLGNAGLANSTISGIPLGSNLADLTATDSSLTFSGSYNGGTARTVGLSAIAANSVLGNLTGSSAVPSAVATSSLYTGSNGQILARSNGAWVGVATTTFSSGLTYSAGNVTADLGTSIDISAETNLTATWPVILTGDALSFGGLSTTSPASVSGLPYWTGVNTFGTVATSSATCTTGVSCSAFTVVGSVAPSITATLGTSIDLASEVAATVLPVANGGTGTTTSQAGRVFYGGGAGVYQSVATGTVSAGTGITISATIAALLNAATIAIDQAANFAWTGVHDFGSAVIEMTNGTAPTVDAIGEFAFDTTDNQLIIASSTNAASPLVYPSTKKLWGMTMASTSVDFVSGGRLWLPPQRDGFTVKEIHCAVDAGTSVVVNLSNSGGTTDSETITCDADGAADTSITTNNTYAAGSLNSLEIGTITGSVDYVTISVWGTYTRE